MHHLKYLTCISLLFLACHTSKKTIPAPTASTPVTPVVTAVEEKDSSKTAEPVKRDVYRGANKRVTDLLHTRLDVSFDWTYCRMNGLAAIYARPHFYATDRLFLNARGMDIKGLKVFRYKDSLMFNAKNNLLGAEADLVEMKGASYVYENDSLKINLGKTFTMNEKYKVEIRYVARPNELKNAGGSNAISDDKGLYFINPTGENPFKMPQIWTQGETQANSVWMPTIDSPNEKMTQEIYMTVEERFTTLSNGVLAESKKNGNGTRTDHWKLDMPHAPYLAMMAVGEFKKVTDNPWKGKEISYYVEKEYEPHATGIFGDTREMIDFYSKKLGVDYPWPKYAQIAVRDYVSGAMENTSATLHGDFVVYQTTREMIDGKKGNSVIAHELFHQWFGDLVTCESWSNLPLNESFATYGEYLWEEYKYGRDAADYHHWQGRQGYMSSPKEVDLIRFNYKDKEDMFDAFSYNKGGQVLHMLRKAVGDEAFFASLRNYLETNRYKSVEIHNLRLAFEETTGQDMNWFFNQWFLNKGRPKLKVSKAYNSANNTLELTVEQNQDLQKAPLYALPLEVDVYVGGQVGRTRITVNEQKQTFVIPTRGEPQLVNFDAERQLLCDLEYKKTREEYVFQYKNAPLYNDRFEALKELDAGLSETEIYNLFKDAAQYDKFHGLRNYAIGRLEKTPDNKLAETKTVLMQVYKNDKKTTTRARALGLLNRKFANDAEVNALNEQALNEASYAICGEALEAMIRNNPKLAMEKAKLFENESGKDVLFPVANLYGSHGGGEQIGFFRKAMKYISGFELITFDAAYVKVAKRSGLPADAITAAMDFEGQSKSAGKFQKYGILKCMKDLVSHWEARETSARAKLEASKAESKGLAEAEKELQTATETKEILTKMYNRCK